MTFHVSKGPLSLAAFHEVQKLRLAKERQRMFLLNRHDSRWHHLFSALQIRNELEKHMNCNLKEFKEFIDNEMLLILGQMDKPSLIFDHLYLVRCCVRSCRRAGASRGGSDGSLGLVSG